MLDIIQMAFGELGKFNESVRSILHAIDWMRSCPREWLNGASPASSPKSPKSHHSHQSRMLSPLSPQQSPPKGSPKGSPKFCFEVPDDSPIPSIPSPKKRRMMFTGWPHAASPAASPRILPEDSPIPSMPSPKEYQWLN